MMVNNSFLFCPLAIEQDEINHASWPEFIGFTLQLAEVG
jgi:hypothetical protein